MFSKMLRNKQGQIASTVMTVIFGTILLVAVAIPITQTTIAEANLTGLTATVVGYIPLFLGLAGLVLAMNLIRG